jgi:hypothetical protein
VRRSAGMACASAACSTARKGPTSLPLGLMTPKVAASKQQPERARAGEEDAGNDHQQCAEQQHAAASGPVGAGRDPKRNRGVPQQRQGQQQANLTFGQTRGCQVQHEHHGNQSVGEEAKDARREQQADVARQGRPCRGRWESIAGPL